MQKAGGVTVDGNGAQQSSRQTPGITNLDLIVLQSALWWKDLNK